MPTDNPFIKITLATVLLLATACAGLRHAEPSEDRLREIVREEIAAAVQEAKQSTQRDVFAIRIPGPGMTAPILDVRRSDCSLEPAEGWPLPVATAYARGYLHVLSGECPEGEDCDPATSVEIECGGETHTLASLLELDVANQDNKESEG